MTRATTLLISLMGFAFANAAWATPAIQDWLPVQDPTQAQARALVALAPKLNPDVAHRAIKATLCAQDQGLAVDKLLVVDMSVRSRSKRLWAFDVSDPANPVLVLHERVAHGSGSDPSGTGRAQAFSNTPDSHQTSLGLYRVAEAYEGVHGGSRRLDGLFDGFNSNARNRAIVMHPSHYVRDDHVGRSQGCPAVSYESMAALEEAGLDKAVLWMDGPDKQLGQDVAQCSRARRDALVAQVREERHQRLLEQLKAEQPWAVNTALPAWDWSQARAPSRKPMPAPSPPWLECPVCPLSRARFDCAPLPPFPTLLNRSYS